MKINPAAPTPFHLRPFHEQVADNLQERILSGQLAGQLPPERELCLLMNVSRPILRRALHRLRDEGLLRIGRGRGAEVVGVRAPRDDPPEARRVILLYADFSNFISRWTLMVIEEILHELAGHGVQFEMRMEPALGRARVGSRLRTLVGRHRADAWILAGTSAAVQQWFANQPLKTLLMGNAFPDVRLPFVNDDLHAVTRHAAGVFLGMGHRNLAYLMRGQGSAGEAREEAGFREGVAAVPDARCQVVRHDGSPERVRERMVALFSRRPSPTALLVSHAEDALTALTWFPRNRLRTPQDVSLISFQWAAFLGRISPCPAWYYADPQDHARKICRLILRNPKTVRPPQLLFPKFLKNETIGPPPA